MFEELREAIGSVVVAPDGDAIVEARRLLERLTAKVAEAEAGYAARGGWQVDGFGSLAAYERHRNRLSDAEGRRVARRAERLHAWPEVLEAWLGGTLTTTQVDLAAAVVPDRHVERFASTAAENVEILAPLDARGTRDALRHWVGCADAAAERESAEDGREVPPPSVERELFVSRTTDDVGDVRGLLDPDATAVVEQALRAATTTDVDGVVRTPARRRADALVEVCRFFVDHHAAGAGGRRQARLTVVAEVTTLYRAALRGAGVRTAEQLHRFLRERPELAAVERGLFLDAFDGRADTARTLEGNPVSDGLLSCVSSGGVLERLLTVEGRVLDLGRSVRTFTPTQRRAVVARDRGCRRAGCDAPAHRCSVHHVVPWEQGGLTDLDNAVLKCDHDHLDDHARGLADELALNGDYTVVTPAGERLTTRPPGRDEPVHLRIASRAGPLAALDFDPSPDLPDDHPTVVAHQLAALARRVEELRRAG